MSIAYEFLKEEDFDGNMEDNILFIIDHYNEAMTMYRVMKQQTEINNKKKEKAHSELQNLRDREAEIRKDKKTLTKQEKLELAEKKKFLEKQREIEPSMYYKGNEIEYNKLSHLILKHKKVFERLDKIDKRGRDIVSESCRVLVSKFLWPLKKMCNVVSNQTTNDTAYQIITDVETFVSNAPDQIKNHISKEITLSDHVPNKPKDKRMKDGEFEISITM